MGKTGQLGDNTLKATTFWLIADQLNTRTEAERLRYIQAGFPPSWIKAIREAFGLSPQRLQQLLNVSMSTLERRQRQLQPLDVVASERLDRLADIAVQAVSVFGNHAIAGRWMVSRHADLGHQTPIRLCETEIGARQVRRLLRASVKITDECQPPPCPEPSPPSAGRPLQSLRSDRFHD